MGVGIASDEIMQIKVDLSKVEIRRAKKEDYDKICKIVLEGLYDVGQILFAKRALKQPLLQVRI